MHWFNCLAFLVTYFLQSSASNCRKEWDYHQNYGYGFTITCTESNISEISDIYIYNLIILTIKNSNVTFNPLIFQNLNKAKEITISNSLVRSQRNEVFKPLQQLEKLSLTGINLTVIEDTIFNGLHKLSNLNLFNNSIVGFKGKTFEPLSQLKVLNVSKNLIKNEAELSICNLVSLERLVLDFNEIAILRSSSFDCLHNLQYLHLNYNKIKTIDVFSIKNLVELNLAGNYIKNNIGNINASNLLRLDLSQNKLTEITNKDFALLKSLAYLDLNQNLIENISDGAFTTNKLLKQLYLNSNNLSWISLNIINLEKLSVSKNHLKHILAKNFTHLVSLKYIDFSSNQIEIIDNITFKDIHGLKEINLFNNHLTEFYLIFGKKNYITEINLGKNGLTSLQNTSFKNYGSLKTLDLSFNELQTFDHNLFEELEELEVLNISYNLLKSLDFECVDPLENLRILDVEGNRLTTLEYKLIINQLPNLEVINIKNNILSCSYLHKMIVYFKQNQINFTINENFEFDKENVAGIYCNELENKTIQLEKQDSIILNNSRILNEIYRISRHDTPDYMKYGIGLLLIILFITVLVLFSIIFKYRKWLRRKEYFIDELELIDDVCEQTKIVH